MSFRTLSDRALMNAVAAAVARDRATTAELLQLLAEVDTRRLYRDAGHPSMFAWCTEALHMSESEAARRIHAARAVRRFPALLAAVAQGRLHLSAVCVLAPHFTRDNFGELVAAATHRTKSEVEAWLAMRFAPPIVRAAAEATAGSSPAAAAPLPHATSSDSSLSLEHPAAIEVATVRPEFGGAAEHLLGDDGAPPSPQAEPAAVAMHPGPGVAPHVVVRVALAPATHAKLMRAQRLLSHAMPAGDVAAVLDRALDALIERLERRKFAAARKPRDSCTPRSRRTSESIPAPPRARRTIPAAVKRAVVARDGERCAFVAPDGRRCSARSRLEFDHMDPVARGGLASADRVRVLCRTHNQLEAERAFGREFMQRKRAVRPEAAAAAAAAAAAVGGSPAQPNISQEMLGASQKEGSISQEMSMALGTENAGIG